VGAELHVAIPPPPPARPSTYQAAGLGAFHGLPTLRFRNERIEQFPHSKRQTQDLPEVYQVVGRTWYYQVLVGLGGTSVVAFRVAHSASQHPWQAPRSLTARPVTPPPPRAPPPRAPPATGHTWHRA
jgi:hypothetical protein